MAICPRCYMNNLVNSYKEITCLSCGKIVDADFLNKATNGIINKRTIQRHDRFKLLIAINQVQEGFQYLIKKEKEK